jgi:hypothetical protein
MYGLKVIERIFQPEVCHCATVTSFHYIKILYTVTVTSSCTISTPLLATADRSSGA